MTRFLSILEWRVPPFPFPLFVFQKVDQVCWIHQETIKQHHQQDQGPQQRTHGAHNGEPRETRQSVTRIRSDWIQKRNGASSRHKLLIQQGVCWFKTRGTYFTTTPKFNCLPLKSYRNPIGKIGSSSNPRFFRGELLNFGGVIRSCWFFRFFLWTWQLKPQIPRFHQGEKFPFHFTSG